jgi:hypothetical protein
VDALVATSESKPIGAFVTNVRKRLGAQVVYGERDQYASDFSTVLPRKMGCWLPPEALHERDRDDGEAVRYHAPVRFRSALARMGPDHNA